MLLLLLLPGCGGSAPLSGSAVLAGFMPHRVHVIEDFETDIEKKWWLAGTIETTNVRPGSRRACRGTTSKDFDDKMGDSAKRYTAVIFNPVPGPPMGKNTRLGFRYWLRGTDRLRVQIFSLTNNYHRQLVLSGLPQGSWQSSTVDMTTLRRPDGTGGPLSEDERIDDIQFYVDPGAELIIDDIVLYDAAAPDEKEPFPARFLFTAWFDTGKQGQEWPGEFEIVSHEKPIKWKAARSLPGDPSRLRISLRGPRPVRDGAVRLRFKYQLSGADEFSVALRNSPHVVVRPAKDQWAEARLTLPGKYTEVDELQFNLDPRGTLWVDDVLLYEPSPR
jgi:hypothetical protein